MGIRLRVVIRENIRCNVGIFMLDNLCLGGDDPRGAGRWGGDCCMVGIVH